MILVLVIICGTLCTIEIMGARDPLKTFRRSAKALHKRGMSKEEMHRIMEEVRLSYSESNHPS